MNAICAICSQNFIARHSYGLCKDCTNRDRLRELDRLDSAIREARRRNVSPISLNLVEWISALSDFSGNCALCKKYTGIRILMVSPRKGLTYENIVPACYACEYHYINGFDLAKAQIAVYLQEDRIPKVIPQNEEELA